LVEESGNKVEQAVIQLEKARALVKLGRSEEATRIAQDSAELLEEASPVDAGRGYTVVADVYEQLGDRDKAIEVYEHAADLLSCIPSPSCRKVAAEIAH